ncbi:NAD(P)-binding protein [Phanerochaete sordida]|uniref:NAD(P)-binding protein n=1 Tax=Phanerochaete sordida TaxID=48140 RepID=A0A9P3GBG4_9APHY|nr:NAD(P)-binding protein [Phanerochaete sordida]
MAAKTPILILGATGYIGGSVLARLLQHPQAQDFDITALVRNKDKAQKLEAFGVRAVVGSYKDDHTLVEKLAEDAHVVFQIVDADDLPAMQALLQGLQNRHERTGDVPVLIHTSGSAIVIEGQDKGELVRERVWDDTDDAALAGISPAALHRNVDAAVFAADVAGYARTYQISPGTMYGAPAGALAAAGVQHTHSIQVPLLIRAALARGRAGMVGRGLPRWGNVHVDDAADLFVLLFDAVTARGADNVGHGTHGYYFAGNDEAAWRDIARAIGDALRALGRTRDAAPTPFSDAELAQYFFSYEIGQLWGTNSRFRASRAKALGWEPKHTTADLLASIRPEVEAIIRESKVAKRRSWLSRWWRM